MGVNIIIVIVCLFLISLAIIHLVQKPEKLEIWIMLGGTDLFGILITMFFNNPRQDAREDLTGTYECKSYFPGVCTATIRVMQHINTPI